MDQMTWDFACRGLLWVSIEFWSSQGHLTSIQVKSVLKQNHWVAKKASNSLLSTNKVIRMWQSVPSNFQNKIETPVRSKSDHRGYFLTASWPSWAVITFESCSSLRVLNIWTPLACCFQEFHEISSSSTPGLTAENTVVEVVVMEEFTVTDVILRVDSVYTRHDRITKYIEPKISVIEYHLCIKHHIVLVRNVRMHLNLSDARISSNQY